MQNPMEVKTKTELATASIATTAITAAVAPASSAAALANLPVEKNDLGTLVKTLETIGIPDNWELIAGEMDKLETEESQEIVVFQNKACKAHTVANTTTAAQQKNNKENQEKDFIHYMFIYRAEARYQTTQGQMKTTDRPICLTLCYENLPEGSKFIRLKDEICQAKHLNIYCRGVFPVSQIVAELKKNPKTAHIPPLLSYMHDFVHFRMSLMKRIDIGELFEALMVREFFSKHEGAFILRLFICRPPSEKEAALYKICKTIADLLHVKDYNGAIEMVKKIHAKTIKDNKIKYHFLLSEQHSDTGNICFLDDESFAYELGENLATCSPEHACLAFGIITGHSPLYHTAQRRISEITTDLCVNAKHLSEKDNYLVRSIGASLNYLMALPAEERAYFSHNHIETIVRHGEIDPHTRIETSLNLGDIVSVLVNELHKKSARIRELSTVAPQGPLKTKGTVFKSVSAKASCTVAPSSNSAAMSKNALSPTCTRPLTYSAPMLDTRHSHAASIKSPPNGHKNKSGSSL